MATEYEDWAITETVTADLPYDDFIQYYDKAMFFSGLGQNAEASGDNSGRIASLLDAANGGARMPMKSDYAPAVPLTVNGLPTLSFANAGEQTASNLGKGYSLPKSKFQPLNKLAFMCVYRMVADTGPAAVFSLFKEGVSSPLLEFGTTTGEAHRLIVARVPGDALITASVARHSTLSTWQITYGYVDFTTETNNVYLDNQPNNVSDTDSLAGTSIPTLGDGEYATIGDRYTGVTSGHSAFLGDIGALWIYPNHIPTGDELTDLRAHALAIRTTLFG